MSLTTEAKYEVQNETRRILTRYAGIFGIANIAVLGAITFGVYQRYDNWQMNQEITANSELEQLRKDLETSANDKIAEGISGFLESSKDKIQQFEDSLSGTKERMDEKIDTTQSLIGKLELVAENAQQAEDKYSELESNLDILSDIDMVSEAAQFVDKYSSSDTKLFLDKFAVTNKEGNKYRTVVGSTVPGKGWKNYINGNKKTFHFQAVLKIDTSWAKLSPEAIFTYTIQAPHCWAREIESAGTLYSHPGDNNFVIFAHGPSTWKPTPGHDYLANGIQSVAENCKWHVRWVAYDPV